MGTHLRAAGPMYVMLVIAGSLLAGIAMVGGVMLASADRLAATTFKLFGQEFTSQSVGVSMAFIGAVMAVLLFRAILKSINHLAGL